MVDDFKPATRRSTGNLHAWGFFFKSKAPKSRVILLDTKEEYFSAYNITSLERRNIVIWWRPSSISTKSTS